MKKINAPKGGFPSLPVWAGHYAGQFLLATCWGYGPRQIEIPSCLSEDPFLALEVHADGHDIDRVAFAAVLAAGRLGEHLFADVPLREEPRVNSFEPGMIRATLAELDYRRESVESWLVAIDAETAAFLRAHQRQGAAVRDRLLVKRSVKTPELAGMLRGVPQGKAYEFYLRVRIRAAECECRRTREGSAQ